MGALGAAAAAILLRHRHRRDCLTFPTMFGPTRIYQVKDDEGREVRLLEVDGIVQSGAYVDDEHCFDLVFEYLKVYDLMFRAERPLRRVCVLGCGGYDYPEHLIAHHDVDVDAVEVDPAITAAARSFFFLDRLEEEYRTEESGRLTCIQDDALAFLETPGHTYDAIVNDTFDGGAPPAHLTTEEFYRAVKSRLARGGLFLTNIVAPLQGPRSRFLYDQRSLMGQVFAHTYLFPCDPETLEEADNIIAVATDEPLPEALAASSL